MNARQQHEIEATSGMNMQATLEAQRSINLDEGELSASTRIDRTIEALVRHSGTLSEAMNEALVADQDRSTLSRQTQL